MIDTQRALIRVKQIRRNRRYFPFIVAGLLFAIPAFLCMVMLLIYLVLPFPQRNILILGVDSRVGEGWVTRADSIMLAGVNPSSLRVALLSIPRDLSIDVPGYGLQRINTVNMLGEMAEAGTGPALTQAGVVHSFGVGVDRYVRLDFNGFVALIDAVGGVTIDVPRALTDYNYPTADYGIMTVTFEAGPQHMDGERALIYARTRYADDDYRRAERQQQVVSALMGQLANPLKWPAAFSVLQRSVDTDINLWDIVTLAPPVILGGVRAEHMVIDRDYITTAADGTVIPDYEKFAPWLESYFD